MKISFNWLKDYIDFDLSPEELAEILTDTGLEIEKVEQFDSLPGGLRGVVVGEVLETAQHPNADKLKTTKVDVGAGEPLDIVCGAPNVATGQKVLVATVGTTLEPKPGESFQIKKAKIRGEVSMGMICAEDELGIGESHDGIMVLPADTEVGLPAATYLGMESDHVLEIGLTPNRTDGFGHFGAARDLAARLNLNKPTKAKLPEIKEMPAPSSDEMGLSITIEDKEGCGRYAGRVIKGLKVGPSPKWLQDRLRAVGQSPINNVVDITNYVQLETGQPLHAFDLAKIDGKEIRVNTLPTGTKFKTLDDEERTLDESDLMISNASGGMCIAGVFGGSESGVKESTSGIFLESAWFNPVRVRKTAKRHGLNTDASFRFERGVDPNGTIYALERATALILEIAGGELHGDVFDEVGEVPNPAEVSFSTKRFEVLSGAKLTDKELESIFESLDIEVISKEGDSYSLRIPTYRVDVTREVDVIEEVLRIYGYNSVEMPTHMRMSVSIEDKPSRHEILAGLSKMLVGRGFNEMMSNGLTQSSKILDVTGDEGQAQLVPMLNPLSQELDVLRPNLVVSSLERVAYNLNRQSERLRLFEIGKRYLKLESGYEENTMLTLTMVGGRQSENWNNSNESVSASDVKGHLESALEFMGVRFVLDRSEGDAFIGAGVSVKVRNKVVGQIGSIAQKALKAYGIKKEVWMAEINLDACLETVKHAATTIKALPKFPSVRRDLSLLVDTAVSFADIERIGLKRGGKLVQEVGLFDVYEGKNLPAGKKSYAVSFVLQDPEKTLNDKVIDKTMSAIQRELESSLGASLR